jgi:Tfp pilus assembly protein PilF
MTQPSRRERIEQMLAKDPNDVFLLYGLAMEYVREGNVEESLQRLQVVVERDPNYHSAYFQAAQLLAQDGRADDARGWTIQGIEAAKRTGNAHAVGEMEGFLMTLG